MSDYVFYCVVPPLIRTPTWPDYTDMRLPLRFRVVKEIIRPRGVDGIRVTGYEQHSAHWTRRAAMAAARAANIATIPAEGGDA